ncbi:MAG TPA: hypothetical protein PK529_09410 [Verrucomicrobiales bacterium]|nr:hypothetical protein [Verrucomicrobiales bacterium]
MKISCEILLVIAVIGFGFTTKADAQFTEEELAETIAYDTGYPPEGYAAYVASLIKTLAKLSPGQIEKVFKGKRPKRRGNSGKTFPPQPGAPTGNGSSDTSPKGKGPP